MERRESLQNYIRLGSVGEFQCYTYQENYSNRVIQPETSEGILNNELADGKRNEIWFVMK